MQEKSFLKENMYTELA